jgi:single stranded DNA-binding protein (ssb)
MLNISIITGRLVGTPELKHTAKGNAVTSFTVAVGRNYKNTNGDYETDFIDVVAWRNPAVFITKNFVKGQLITIHGSTQTRIYEDKHGNKRKSTALIVERCFFAGVAPTAASEASVDENFDNFDDILPEPPTE